MGPVDATLDLDAGRRPNIVLVVADDLGFSDLGCYGSEIATPHIDALALEGMRFSSFYNNAKCCPSRASLLTGLYPAQTGVGHMVHDLGLPGYRGFLGEKCVTIAEVLGGAGYRTVMAGKWHVGGTYSVEDLHAWKPGTPGYPRPIDRGFDEHFGTLTGAGSYYDPHTLVQNDEWIEPGPGFYYTDAINRYATDAVRRCAGEDRPFFLYVAHVAPHWPLHAPEGLIAGCRDHYRIGWDEIRTRRHARLVDEGLLDPAWPLTPRDELADPWDAVADPRWEAARMACYAAQVEAMDRGIGDIIDALRDEGVAGQTLVLFLSDNGGAPDILHEEAVPDPPAAPTRTRDGRHVRVGNVPGIDPGPETTFASYGPGWANASNTPFRLYKNWVHEGGISTPCVAWWPGTVPPGTVRHDVCHVMDLMPTLVDLAGAHYPAQRHGVALPAMEGMSLDGVLRGGATLPERLLCWEHQGNRAVRRGPHKLVSRWPGGWELYDLHADRTELHDISARTALVEDLSGEYEAWEVRCGVQPWARLEAGLRRFRPPGWKGTVPTHP